MKSHGLLCTFLLMVWASSVSGAILSGTVVDAEGKPIADAQVWLHRTVYREESQRGLVASMKTAADGAFSLVDPDYDDIEGKGRWMLVAYKQGLALDGAHTSDIAKPFELKLVPPETISGKILDEAGKPLPGATVAVTNCRVGQYGQPGFRRFVLLTDFAKQFGVQTDQDGAFALHLTPPGASVTLYLCAAGYGSFSISSPVDVSALRLQPAGSIKGRIVAPEKLPDMAKARLMAFGRMSGRDMSASGEAKVDANGEFEFPELPPGSYLLHISSQPGDAYHVQGKSDIEVKSGKETVVELQAQKTAVIRGRVIAGDTGQGLADVSVSISEAPSGRTQQNGTFEVHALPGDKYIRVFPDEGYLGTRYEERIAIELGPEGADVGDIKLERAHTLKFLVVDEQDQPVEEAMVTVRVEGDRDYFPAFSSQTTDENGIYEKSSLRAGAIVSARAAKGNAMSEKVKATVGETEQPVKLVLKADAAAAITAIIVDQNGKPVVDAEVSAYERGENWGRSIRSDPPDENGRIECKGLTPGWQYQFRVKAPDSDRLDTGIWTAVAGETHDFGTIKLTRHTAFLAGVVVDGAGKPLGGAKVFNVGDTPGRKQVSTDEQGRFRLSGLAEGRAYAYVDAPGCRFTAAAAPTGTADLKIVLRPQAPGTMGNPPAPRANQLPPDQAKALARKLLIEAAEQTHGAAGYYRQSLLQALAQVDPTAAYEMAAKGGDEIWPINVQVARLRMADDCDEALALMKESFGTYGSYDLTRGLLGAADDQLSEHPDIARRCLEEALKVTPTLSVANKRVLYAALAARKLQEIAPQRAEQVYEQIVPLAASLSGADYDAFVRGMVAEQICDKHFDMAMQLIDGIQDQDEKQRHLTNIARHIAKTDPDRAVDMLKKLSDEWQRDYAYVRMLPFFPPDRFDHAIEIASGLSRNELRARALALLAQVGPEERVPQLLEQAAGELIAEATEQGMAPGGSRLAQSMARLACVARRLGYQQYMDFALRAASLHIRGAESGYVDTSLNVREDFTLAIQLAYTSPEFSRHITESALQRARGVAKLNGHCYSTLAAAAAEVDITWAGQLLKQMPPDDPSARRLCRTEAARAVVRRLLETPEEREHEMLTSYENWIVVDEDY